MPSVGRFALIQFAEQIEWLTTRIEIRDRENVVALRQDADAVDENHGRRPSRRRCRTDIGD